MAVLDAELIARLPTLAWMKSRIPAIDALETIVRDDDPKKRDLWHVIEAFHRSRWSPISIGHRVLVPYEGQEYDPKVFEIAIGAWDHEHCDLCDLHIPAMTLLWVTREDPYVQLRERCFRQRVRKPWWNFLRWPG